MSFRRCIELVPMLEAGFQLTQEILTPPPSATGAGMIFRSRSGVDNRGHAVVGTQPASRIQRLHYPCAFQSWKRSNLLQQFRSGCFDKALPLASTPDFDLQDGSATRQH